MIRTVKKTDREFPLVHFVAKIVPTYLEQDQFNLGFIKVTKELLISTDGHRLHTADNSQVGMEPGYYVVVKCLKGQVQLDKLGHDRSKFPDISPIINVDTENYAKFNLANRTKEYSIHTTFALVIRTMAKENTMNIDYLREAIDSEEILSAAIPKDAQPSVFYGARCRAYIMPMKM